LLHEWLIYRYGPKKSHISQPILVIFAKITHCQTAQWHETYNFTVTKKYMHFLFCHQLQIFFEAGDCLNLCLSFLIQCINVYVYSWNKCLGLLKTIIMSCVSFSRILTLRKVRKISKCGPAPHEMRQKRKILKQIQIDHLMKSSKKTQNLPSSWYHQAKIPNPTLKTFFYCKLQHFLSL